MLVDVMSGAQNEPVCMDFSLTLLLMDDPKK